MFLISFESAMASKRRKVSMGAKRKQLASASDDEKDQSDTPKDDDDDDTPLFRYSPSSEKAPVAKKELAKEGPSKVRETIIGGWRVVRLDGQSVRVKLTREEKHRIRGERDPEISDSQDEDSEHEPDYLLSDEERPFIDTDDTDNLPIMALRPAAVNAGLARGAVGALGKGKIGFDSYSARE
jgi:hypothetical protein